MIVNDIPLAWITPSGMNAAYGFLAPGAVASANATSQGKIYTFQIVE